MNSSLFPAGGAVVKSQEKQLEYQTNWVKILRHQLGRKTEMNYSKTQNRFFAFFKTTWRQTRLCVKSFLVAVFILVLLAVMHYVTLYLYISSGGLNFFVRDIAPWLYLGVSGLLLCLYFWALICLIISVINIKKPANIVFAVLGTILLFVINCLHPAVSVFFGQPDKDIMRYYAHNMHTIEKLNEFSQKIQSLSTDENFTFTKQSIKDLSETRPYDDKKYVFYYPDFDFNRNLLDLKPGKIHTDVVLLFQSENDRSLFSDYNNISAEWHYDRGSLIVFGDGRLEFIKKENFKNLRWKP